MQTIFEAFILLLFIMDPVVSMAALLSLGRSRRPRELRRVAFKATAVALMVFLVFAFGGDIMLRGLGADLNTFKAAGGVILVVLGMQMALGLTLPKEKSDISEIAVVIGTPLIAGPATITTTMIMAKEIGILFTLISGLAALFVILLCLLFSGGASKVIGKGGIRMLTTMMGIVTIAWGLQFLLTGVVGFLG